MIRAAATFSAAVLAMVTMIAPGMIGARLSYAAGAITFALIAVAWRDE